MCFYCYGRHRYFPVGKCSLCHVILFSSNSPPPKTVLSSTLLMEIRKQVKNNRFGTTNNRVPNHVFHGNFSDFYCGMLADSQTWTASYSAQFLPTSSHFFRIFPSLTTSLCPVTISSIQSPVYITSSSIIFFALY